MQGLSSNTPRRVVLHGFLKKLHPEGSLLLTFNTPAEAIEMITSQVPELFRNHNRPQIPIQIVANNRWIKDPEEIFQEFKGDELHLVPMVCGGKNFFTTILIAAALVAASFIPGLNTYVAAALFSAGIGVALMGISQLLQPTPKADKTHAPSGSFGPPKNTVKIGTRVALCYGKRVAIGGQILSYNVDSKDRMVGSYPGVNTLSENVVRNLLV